LKYYEKTATHGEIMTIRIGDTFEIETPKGVGYIQFAYRDKRGIEYVRVIDGLFKCRPDNLKEFVDKKERYIVGFPLTIGASRNVVGFVANILLPADFAMPKLMRSDHFVRGEFLGWHIVNVSNWKRKLVSKLSEQEEKLSPWGIWNDTLLKERLAADWRLESWV